MESRSNKYTIEYVGKKSNHWSSSSCKFWLEVEVLVVRVIPRAPSPIPSYILFFYQEHFYFKVTTTSGVTPPRPSCKISLVSWQREHLPIAATVVAVALRLPGRHLKRVSFKTNCEITGIGMTLAQNPRFTIPWMGRSDTDTKQAIRKRGN